MVEMNEQQLSLMKEWFQKKSEFYEKYFWVGCVTEEQCEEGFRLMFEFSKYTKEIIGKIRKLEDSKNGKKYKK